MTAKTPRHESVGAFSFCASIRATQPNDIAATTFRTKTGTCSLDGGRILLDRSGARGAVAKAVVGAFNLAVALFLIHIVWRSRGLSAASDISFAAVTSIESHAPVPPLTRGYFVVQFEDGEKALRRMIILPGVAEGGSAEYAKAVEALRQAGIYIPH